MRYLVIIVSIILLSLDANSQDAIALKYNFKKGEVQNIEVIAKTPEISQGKIDLREYKTVLECKTEDILMENNEKIAIKYFRIKDFSVKHFKKDEQIEIDEKEAKVYAGTIEEVLKLFARLRQDSVGNLALDKKQDKGFDPRFLNDFDQYVSVPLPIHPVKPGETWRNPSFKPLREKKFNTNIKVEDYCYIGDEKAEGVLCAKIIGENYLESSRIPVIVRNKPDSEEAKLLKDKKEYVNISEVIYFDVEKGRIIKQLLIKETMILRKENEFQKDFIEQIIRYTYK